MTGESASAVRTDCPVWQISGSSRNIWADVISARQERRVGFCQVLVSLRPRGGLIATAVQNSGDHDVPAVSIVDDVILDGERSDGGAELRPKATHPRLFGQQFDALDNGVDESVRGCRAGVLGDVGPDLVEVLLSESGQPIGIYDFVVRTARPRDLTCSASFRPEFLS